MFSFLRRLFTTGLICPRCDSSLQDLVIGPFHGEISDMGTAYCDRCGSSLHYQWELSDEITKIAPWELQGDEKQYVENCFVNCSCGGNYKFDAPPLCPICKESIADLREESNMFLRVEPILHQRLGGKVWKQQKYSSKF